MTISDDSVNSLLDSLLELHPKKIDLSLDRSFALLNKLGNPQDKIQNIVHFAGTNGKFSTLNFVKEILKYNKKSINAYISPHLVKFNERFEIQDQIVSNETLHKTQGSNLQQFFLVLENIHYLIFHLVRRQNNK